MATIVKKKKKKNSIATVLSHLFMTPSFNLSVTSILLICPELFVTQEIYLFYLILLISLSLVIRKNQLWD